MTTLLVGPDGSLVTTGSRAVDPPPARGSSRAPAPVVPPRSSTCSYPRLPPCPSRAVTGAHAADNIAAVLQGRPEQPFSFAWYGQGIALGPNDAVGFGAYPDDQAGRFIVRGKAAVYLRRFFISFLRTVLKIERRLPGFFFWNGKQRYTRQRRQDQQRQMRSSQ